TGAQAHDTILADLKKGDDVFDLGTTTFIGGILFELDSALDRWAFICASVGDCKAFLYRAASRTVVDITLFNRTELDVRDPGGRLGPHLKGGAPDTRNLQLFWEACDDEDIIILMSDGIHDNLDPELLG